MLSIWPYYWHVCKTYMANHENLDETKHFHEIYHFLWKSHLWVEFSFTEFCLRDFFSCQYFLCRNYFGFPYPNHISFFPQNYLILPKQHHFSKTTQFPQNYSISPKLHHFTHLPFIIILKLIYFHNWLSTSFDNSMWWSYKKFE